MDDVFDSNKSEQPRDPQEQKMIEVLQQNHWAEKVILRRERDQRILHEHLVDRKSLIEIAAGVGLSAGYVRQIIQRATYSMQNYFYRLKYESPVKEEPDKEPVVIKEFGYNIYDIMIEPDESRIDEVKQLLSTPVEDFGLSVRTFNCFKMARLNLVGDVLQFSIKDLLLFKNFGKRSLIEIENLLTGMGLKFTSSSVDIVDYIKNIKASKPVYAIKPPLQFTLPISYPVLNFTWSDEIQLAFKEHNIITVDSLLMARELFSESKNISPVHFSFIEQRLKEWGLKWK